MIDLDAGDWIALVGSLSAAAGLVFAGLQIKETKDDRRKAEVLAIKGVSISWQPIESPNEPEPGGMAQWLFEFTVDNPGKMPIDRVTAVVDMGTPVARVHFNGIRDAATESLTLFASVVPGGSTRKWMRRVELPFKERAGLNNMRGTVSFRDVENEPQKNSWPRSDV